MRLAPRLSRRTGSSSALGAVLLVAACGGAQHPAEPAAPDEAGEATTQGPPRLVPHVAGEQWYLARSTCGQGPYEVEIAATGARWGEDVELELHTPRPIALNAVILVDGVEVGKAAGVYGASGPSAAAPDNARCVADARERLAIGRPGGGPGGNGGNGTTATPGHLVVPPGTPVTTTTAQLDLDPSPAAASTAIVHVHLPRPPNGTPPRLTIRFWSALPNDLLDVRFGVAHVVWGPTVPEAEYDAFLAAAATRAEDARRRADEDARRRAEEDARRRAEEAARPHPAPRPLTAAEIEGIRRRQAEEAAAAAREAADRAAAEAARLAALQRAADDEARRLALEAARARQRDAFCAAHHDDRDCWGPGGYAAHAALDQHDRERTAYCGHHPEEARCWSEAEWDRHRVAWRERIDAALAPPKPPSGPPPAPLAEVTPPRLSAHAEWRPGYWQWTDGTWVWLAGMWRVPEADIVAEQTTLAPAAPPPPTVEAPPAPPVSAAIWIAGFWQWDGARWVWIPGAYQLRPAPRATWRPAEWRARGGGVHVLIPGGWITVQGGL